MKKLLFASLMCIIVLTLHAQSVPKDYYSKIDGLKKETLKSTLGGIIKNHTKRSYDQLKTDYTSVYVVTGTSSQVYDLYSDKKYNYSSGGWNREHTVANSWWGGTKNEAYSDLFSVIPSETKANSMKSNYPPAEIAGTVSSEKDSGRIRVGKPKSGQGGGFSWVWEPYDEFKGDFARIIFYVATCYADINWGQSSSSQCIKKETWPTLQPWLYQLLLKWHNQDPVCEKEIEINDAVQKIQKNRNPFIDYPILADYIWGELTNVEFDLDEAIPHQHYNGVVPSETFAVSPTNINFGNVKIGVQQVATIKFTPNDLKNNVTVSSTLGTVSQSSIPYYTTSNVEVTVTYTPTVAGNFSGVVTFTDGTTTKKVTISMNATSDAPIIEDGNTFVKVTTAPSDWSGTYLIVYEGKPCAFDGSISDNFDVVGNNIGVTIENGVIKSTASVSYGDYTFTMAKYGNGYSIISKSGYYLGIDGKKPTMSKTNATEFSISLDKDGNALISPRSSSTYALKFNDNKDTGNRFRFYTSGQQPICLYKVTAESMVEKKFEDGIAIFTTKGDAVLTKSEYNAYINTLSGVNVVDLTSAKIAVGITASDLRQNVSPNALIIMPENSSITGTNIVVDEECMNLKITDGYSFQSPLDFIAYHAEYERESDGIGTICLPFAPSTNGFEFYEFETSDDERIYFSQTNAPQAYIPYIYKKTGASNKITGEEQIVSADEVATDGNLQWDFIGVLRPVTLTVADNAYGLYSEKIYHNTGTMTVKPFRAYFTNSSSEVKEMKIYLDGESTGISMTEDGVLRYTSGDAFNLAGQKVGADYKGVVIINGRKELRK